MSKIIISPSILSADFKNLKKEIDLISQSKAEFLHFDVMDGHFVDNISFGLPVLESIASSHRLINDVHIMISNPLKYAQRFVKAGANILTFHYEACKDDEEVLKIIDIIHQNGAKAGLSIKPQTDVKKIASFIKEVDLILIMSVEPGFGGQSFMDNSLPKIRYLRQYIDDNNLNTLIEVDGGINEETAKLVKEAGVDVIVAGSFIFHGQDYKEQVEKLLK